NNIAAQDWVSLYYQRPPSVRSLGTESDFAEGMASELSSAPSGSFERIVPMLREVADVHGVIHFREEARVFARVPDGPTVTADLTIDLVNEEGNWYLFNLY